MEPITVTRPMEAHGHFREGPMLEVVVPATARHFDIAVAMPNLTQPITTPAAARDYCTQIRRAARPVNDHFRPLGIAYLTDDLSPDTIEEGFRKSNEHGERSWHAAKLYPANATTNSAKGVTKIENVYSTLERMEKIGMPVLIHGELLEWHGVELPPWEREAAFVEKILPGILRRFPNLKIVLEHISTAVAADFVHVSGGKIAATITPHHLVATAADMARGGWRTHAYCMPILKGAHDRRALRSAAVNPVNGHGEVKFFAGTDSAPHLASAKHSDCCPGGAFVAPGALEVYAAVFNEEKVFDIPDGPDLFEKFMSKNGPAFYGIEASKRTITLVPNQHDDTVHERFFVPTGKLGGGAEEIVPFFHEKLGFAPKLPFVVGHVVKPD